MDPSANLSDSQPESLSTLSDPHTEDIETSLPHKPTYVESLFCKRHTDAITDPSKNVPKPLSCMNKSVSEKRPGIETMADLDSLTSPNCGLSECRFSEDHTNLQPTLSAVNCPPEKSELSVHKYSAPSTCDSPQITHSLTSTPSHPVHSKTLLEHHHKEHAVHYSLKQDRSTREVTNIVSPIAICLTDQSYESDQSNPEAALTLCDLRHDNNNTDPSTLFSDLSSGLTESDSAVEPLFIFESDTQDFLNLSTQSNPALDHLITSLRSNQVITSERSSDPQFPQTLYNNTCIPSEQISPGPLTQSHHHLFTKVDLDSNSKPCTQHIGLEPPTETDRVGKDGTCVNSQAVQRDNPIDLWMDACQYLSGEDKEAGKQDSEGIILDLCGNSVLREEGVCADTLSWSCPADTKASGYPYTEEGDAVQCASSGDIGGVWGAPHTERWSSVDSWETALSDWVAIIDSPPEDITAAFMEIGAGIDALTRALAQDSEGRSTVASLGEATGQASMQEDPLDRSREDTVESDFHPQTQTLMTIQDKTLELQPRPDLCVSPGGSGSTTTSQNTQSDPTVIKELLEVKPEGSIATPREENKHAGETKSTLDQDSAYPVDTHSSCVTLTSLGECSTDVSTAAQIPGCPGIPAVLEDSVTYMCQFRGHVGSMDRDGDTSNKEDFVLLHIEEDVDESLEKESTPSGLNTEEPHEGAVYKLTAEENVPEQDSLLKDGDSQHYVSELTDSHPTVRESETVESEASAEDLYDFNDATHVLRNTHASPEAKTGLLGNADKQASHDTSPLHQNVLPSDGPAAPLAIGRSLLCVTNVLEGDHDCAQVEVSDDNKEPSCPPDTKTGVPLLTLEVAGDTPLQGHCENKTESTEENKHSNCDKEHWIWELKEDLPENAPLNQGSCNLEDDTEDRITTEYNTRNITKEIDALSRDLVNLVTVPGDHFLLPETSRVAYFTLDIVDPFFPKATKDTAPPGLQNAYRPAGWEEDLTMPHKTHRSHLDFKTRSKKDKCVTGLHPATPTCKRQDNLTAQVLVHQPTEVHDNHAKIDSLTGLENLEDGSATAGKGPVVTDTLIAKSHSKKKKKHITQNTTVVKSGLDPPSVKEENGGKHKAMEGKIGIFEAKFGTKIGKTKDKLAAISGKPDSVLGDAVQKQSQHPEAKACTETESPNGGTHVDLQPFAPMKLDDDAVKRRRLSENKFGKMVSSLESKVTKTEVPVVLKREEAKAGVDMTRRKAYSDVVKQKTPREEPRVVEVIQAEAVSGDPLSLRLWCQFSTVFDDHTITWSREGTTLSELKRSGEDESRVSVTISKASRQDLGKYECVLTSLHGRLSLDYLLTYEVLSEIVVLARTKTIPSSPLDIVGNQENVHCSWLLFKEDFLSQQYFGENQAASIITEEVHFGEGMHRRAFRTKLQAGQVPQLEPGNTCVLKVHNSISYGTKNNQELVQKNFDLAVEECQVQNTAREYIKAYTTVAQSAEAFGEVPEIIPIYLVHRPSNDVPYATLEEELLGDFVKYSVRDGKEINLTRRDSEAGQKCCAFQHWVYNKTEGNLLVTDMQGVGMRLTDVGIATCKKGYKGFRGNCATSFIDQFKALHMCNKYCEILGLASLQPKPKKPSSKPKPKPPPSTAANPKKKVFGPTVKGNSR